MSFFFFSLEGLAQGAEFIEIGGHIPSRGFNLRLEIADIAGVGEEYVGVTNPVFPHVDALDGIEFLYRSVTGNFDGQAAAGFLHFQNIAAVIRPDVQQDFSVKTYHFEGIAPGLYTVYLDGFRLVAVQDYFNLAHILENGIVSPYFALAIRFQ